MHFGALRALDAELFFLSL